MHIAMRCLALAAGLLVCAPSLAQDAEAWLQRMTQALQRTDYRGVLIYSQGGQMHGVQVYRSASGDAPRERLIALDGAEREVLREGRRVICQRGGSTPVAGLPGGLDSAAADSGSLENYQLKLEGEDRVAGLATQIVTIEPRDAFRYGQRIWLEQETGLPLRSVLFGSDARVASQSLFAQIELGYRPSAAELGACADGSTPTATPGEQASGTPRWTVRDLPPGFRLLRAMHDAQRAGAEHQVYSDGLALVSIYIEPRAAAIEPLSGGVQRGALSLFGRALGNVHITVVGEVPALTVERMAQGMVDLRAPGG